MLTGYKTIIVGAALTILGAIQGLDWAHIITNPTAAGWVVSGIGVVMMILRALTTTPVATPKP